MDDKKPYKVIPGKYNLSESIFQLINYTHVLQIPFGSRAAVISTILIGTGTQPDIITDDLAFDIIEMAFHKELKVKDLEDAKRILIQHIECKEEDLDKVLEHETVPSTLIGVRHFTEYMDHVFATAEDYAIRTTGSDLIQMRHLIAALLSVDIAVSNNKGD